MKKALMMVALCICSTVKAMDTGSYYQAQEDAIVLSFKRVTWQKQAQSILFFLRISALYHHGKNQAQ